MIALRDPPIKARCIIRSMKISGTHYRTIWPTAAGTIRVIDQSRLPFEFATIDLETLEDAALAIRSMVVRGAPLIGATAAYGMALALRTDASDARIEEAARVLEATRPTAVDLAWASARRRERRTVPVDRRSWPRDHPRARRYCRSPGEYSYPL